MTYPMAPKFAVVTAPIRERREKRYRVIHTILGLVHCSAIAAALTYTLVKSLLFNVPVYLTVFSRDTLGHEIAGTWSVDLVIAAVLCPLPSAIGHAVIALSLDPVNVSTIARYADYALSSPVMVMIIAILCGLNDIVQFSTLMILQSALCAIGGVAMRTTERMHAYILFAIASIIHVGVWGFIMTAIFTPEPQPPNGWAIGMVVGLFSVFSLFALADALKLSGKLTADATDLFFCILSATAKVYLQWLVLDGAIILKKQLEWGEANQSNGGDDDQGPGDFADSPELKNTVESFGIITASVAGFTIFLTLVIVLISRKLK